MLIVEGPCCMDQPVDAMIPGPRGLMQYGRSSGVPAAACGSGRRQQLPPRLLDACRFASAARDRLLVSSGNIGFHQGTPIVPRRFLPTHAAMFGNYKKMLVTRCVSAALLGTALDRGGTMTAASGW